MMYLATVLTDMMYAMSMQTMYINHASSKYMMYS